jgi:hypothetical protein
MQHLLKEVDMIINNAHDGHANPYYSGTDSRSAEALAGNYTTRAAIKFGYIDFASLDRQLELLKVSGAKFDYAMALEAAKNTQKCNKACSNYV